MIKGGDIVMENVASGVGTSEVSTHLTTGKGNNTASEMFSNGFSFKPRGVHFPDFFFSIGRMIS